MFYDLSFALMFYKSLFVRDANAVTSYQLSFRIQYSAAREIGPNSNVGDIFERYTEDCYTEDFKNVISLYNLTTP